MRHRLQAGCLALACGALNVAAAPAFAEDPQWSDWEREHAVEQNGAWLVIKGDTGCYVKQSYESSNRMELNWNGGEMILLAPYISGVASDFVYWTDDGDKRRFDGDRYEETGQLPAFPDAALAEMKRGRRLRVRVEPKALPERTQVFSLMGLRDSIATARSSVCAAKSQPATDALTVQLESSEHGVMLAGSTILPKILDVGYRVSLEGGEQIGSGTLDIEHGKYRQLVTPKAQDRSAVYVVEFFQTAWGLQSEAAAQALERGRELPKAIRKETPGGDYLLDYTVTRELENVGGGG